MGMFNTISDANHYLANQSFKGSKNAMNGMIFAAGTAAPALSGAVVGGLYGDSASTGAMWGAGFGMLATGAQLAHGRHLGTSQYIYKTSNYTRAGLPKDTVVLPGTSTVNFDRLF